MRGENITKHKSRVVNPIFSNAGVYFLLTVLSCIVSPIKLQRYRTSQRSKFTFKTYRDQYFVVHLHVGSFSNFRLRCNFMGLTICSKTYLRIFRTLRHSHRHWMRSGTPSSLLQSDFLPSTHTWTQTSSQELEVDHAPAYTVRGPSPIKEELRASVATFQMT